MTDSTPSVPVLCHRLHTGGGKWCWVDGAPNAQCLEDANTFGWQLETAVDHTHIDTLQRQLAEAQAGMERRGDDMIVPMHLLDEINASGYAWKQRAEAAEASLADARRDAEALRALLAEARGWLPFTVAANKLAARISAAMGATHG